MIAPAGKVTRAEAVTIVYRLLTGFISETYKVYKDALESCSMTFTSSAKAEKLYAPLHIIKVYSNSTGLFKQCKMQNRVIDVCPFLNSLTACK